MIVRRIRLNEMKKEVAYAAVIAADERDRYFKKKREEQKKLKEKNEKMISLFKMFYGKYFCEGEMKQMMKKFQIPRDMPGVANRLALILEKKGLDSQKWRETAAKIFGI